MLDELLAFLAGVLIPVQGGALGGLAEHLGSYIFAAFTTLVLSTIGLSLFAVIRRPFTSKKLGLRQLFRRNVFRWQYLFCGAPGAIFITVNSLAIIVIGFGAAAVCANVGQMAYWLTSEWKKFGTIRKRSILSAGLMVLATFLVVMGSTREEGRRSFDIVFILIMITVTMFAAGIVWQFGLLSEIQDKSSVPASAIVSTSTGALAELVLALGVAVLGFGPYLVPISALAVPFAYWWVYLGVAASMGIIPISAHVTSKIGPGPYVIIMTTGSYIASFTGVLIFAPAIFTMSTLLQFAGCAAAFSAVLITKKERQSPPKTAPVPV